MRKALAVALSLALLAPPSESFAQALVGLGAAPEGPGALGAVETLSAPGFADFVSRLPELHSDAGASADLASADSLLGRIVLEAAPALRSGAVQVRRSGGELLVTPFDRPSAEAIRIDLSRSAKSDPRSEALGRELREAVQQDRTFGGEGTESLAVLDRMFDLQPKDSVLEVDSDASEPFSVEPEDMPSIPRHSPLPEIRIPDSGEREGSSFRDSDPVYSSRPAAHSAPEAPAASKPSIRAAAWLGATSAGLAAFGAASAAATVFLWKAAGEPLGIAAAFPLLALAAANLPIVQKFFVQAHIYRARLMGGVPLNEKNFPDAARDIRELAALQGVETPHVFVIPIGKLKGQASARAVAGAKKGVLYIGYETLYSADRRTILAHEMHHLGDFRKKRFSVALAHAANRSFMLGAAYGLGSLIVAAVTGGPVVHHALFAAASAASALVQWPAYVALMEFRADMGAIEKTGDLDGIMRQRAMPAGGGSFQRRWLGSWVRSAMKDKGGLWSLFGLGMPDPAAPPAAAAARDDQKPEFYTAAPPGWAARLAPDAAAFDGAPEAARYSRQVEQLRPLARWMAHFYGLLKEQGIQRPPNLLTIQDIVNWASFVRKFEGDKGWTLKAAVKDGVDHIFKNSLPSEKYEDRELRQEIDALMRELEPALEALPAPEHLARLAMKPRPAPKDDPTNEPDPVLFKSDEAEAMDPPDMIMTKTPQEREEDLLMLYSIRSHKEKFWPLIEGPTGEGKSAVIRRIFSEDFVRNLLKRSVPVVSIPVKESMTKRELFGGQSANGIEYGFFTQAAIYGWALVLEELDQASGEFKKSLNKALHQIRKEGFFEFELGGRTHRIQVHPHFWLVGTKNGTEGNYANTRNPDPPDFVKRFVYRYFDRIPPAEQAEIMRGLAVKWYGEAFVGRQGLTLPFLEKLMTEFHEKIRLLTKAGTLGGDFQEPYEFNRRTLHRFLRRYLSDLSMYEDAKRPLDPKTRHLLLARELMEAYGTEVRLDSERQAIWDRMNVVFELKDKFGIEPKDIEIEVQGMYQETPNGVDRRLIVKEKLVPMAMAIRANGGPRVKGPEHRLTLVPSLAASIYRSLRNRQFHDPQFSTGPTGTAKTSEQFFISNLLGEPLFDINMDEQTSPGELHGQFVKDPQTGNFKLSAGVLARTMMYDPQGLLKRGPNGKISMSPVEVQRSPNIGATLLIDEANANTIIETVNPALDNGVLNLKDGVHTAVAGGNTHYVLAMNPVGEGYAGYPITEAMRSRGQTVYHQGDMPEDELTEIILDSLTGVTRFQLQGP